MADLLSLRAFVAAAQHGGFAPAGRALGLSRDRVSKLVCGLEHRLGKALFHRSTRSFALTEAGAIYLERVRRALGELDEADRSLKEADLRPRGRLAVHAPLSWGLKVLSPLCLGFREAFPDVEVELTLDDALIEPMPDKADVVIRISTDAKGQRLGSVSRQLYASPAYVAEMGEPLAPHELRGHRFVGYSNLRTGPDWVLHRGGETQRVRARGAFSSNVGLAVLDAVLAGAGVGLLPNFLAEEFLEAGRLANVLPEWRSMPSVIAAASPPALAEAPKVRAYLSFLRAQIGRQ